VPTPATIIQTQIVSVAETQIVTVVETQEVPVQVVVTATPGPVSGEVKVLLVGTQEEDGIDPVTGKTIPGSKQLEKAFETAYPAIDLQIINIPWGSGATGYGPKTEAMIQGQEACLYMLGSIMQYGRRGYVVNLDPLIANDPDWKDVWGEAYLTQFRGWGPGNPDNQWALPYRGDNRVIHWDAKLFKDWGVEPLSDTPTLAEIEEKSAKMTGINPVTGEQNYGYWYQGKYAVWQFMAMAHAMGATWGKMNSDDGTFTVTWDTPEMLAVMEEFVKLSKFAPAGALAADAMPQGFLSDQNVVAIIPEGEPGYYLQPILSDKALAERFRVSYNLKGADGRGGLFAGLPMAMAASCPNQAAAWVAMKWLSGSPESMLFNFQAVGNVPVIIGGADAVPGLKDLPGNEGEIIVNQNATADAGYPWGGEPRSALQDAIEAALAGTLSPKDALAGAQARTDAWLAAQK
jgi:hypothetical protein